MDINGRPFAGATLLEEIGVPLDQVYQVVVLEDIENRYLEDALVKLDMASDGLDTPATKGWKLYALLGARGITISNLVQLHKQPKQRTFQNMFYAFLNAVAKNTQQNNLQTGQAISTMATTLDSLTTHIRDLPTQLASMSLSSQQMANKYAKQPTLPFQSFHL